MVQIVILIKNRSDNSQCSVSASINFICNSNTISRGERIVHVQNWIVPGKCIRLHQIIRQTNHCLLFANRKFIDKQGTPSGKFYQTNNIFGKSQVGFYYSIFLLFYYNSNTGLGQVVRRADKHNKKKKKGRPKNTWERKAIKELKRLELEGERWSWPDPDYSGNKNGITWWYVDFIYLKVTKDLQGLDLEKTNKRSHSQGVKEEEAFSQHWFISTLFY